MRWIQGGPRRASPTSARWNRLGRIEVARLRIGGDRPLQVLLVGDRAALDDLGPDGADLASSTAAALAAATGRGVDLDLLGAPLTALPAVEETDRFWRLWRYQALVVLLPADSGDRARVLQTIERVLPRVRAQSVVLIADLDGADVPPLPASSRSGAQPAGCVTLDPGADGAAVAGATVASALVELGLPDPDGPVWEEEPDPVRPPVSVPGAVAARAGLNRVVLIAKRSFGVDVAAVNLLTGAELVTVAAIGGGLGRRPRVGSLYDRVGNGGALDVVPDTWREPALRGDPVVQEPGGIRFYAGHAIDAPSGARVGALCIYDRQPHHPTEFDFSMLRDLALLAEAELVAAGSG